MQGMKLIYYPDHDERYAHIPKSERHLYPDEIRVNSTIFKRNKLREDIASADFGRYGVINAYLLAKDEPYTDHGGRICVRRLELETELRVMERRKEEISLELRHLREYCPHVEIKTVDYIDGGGYDIRDHCNDCGDEDYRGNLARENQLIRKEAVGAKRRARK